MKTPSEEIHGKSLKSTQVTYLEEYIIQRVTTLMLTIRVYLHSFPLLVPKSAKSRVIPREFELIAIQGHPRSSILVSIESAYVTSISHLDDLLPFSRYWRLKLENGLFFPPLPCLMPRTGNPSEFLDETYPAKTRGMGLPYGENFIIPTSTVFYGSG